MMYNSDKSSKDLKILLHRLDISTKIFQWVQGGKLLLPVAFAVVVWACTDSPKILWATRAWSPCAWRRKWMEANKAKTEGKGFTDVELAVLGAKMAGEGALTMPVTEEGSISGPQCLHGRRQNRTSSTT